MSNPGPQTGPNFLQRRKAAVLLNGWQPSEASWRWGNGLVLAFENPTTYLNWGPPSSSLLPLFNGKRKPEPTDPTVKKYDGAWFPTADSERSFIVPRGGDNDFYGSIYIVVEPLHDLFRRGEGVLNYLSAQKFEGSRVPGSYTPDPPWPDGSDYKAVRNWSVLRFQFQDASFKVYTQEDSRLDDITGLITKESEVVYKEPDWTPEQEGWQEWGSVGTYYKEPDPNDTIGATQMPLYQTRSNAADDFMVVVQDDEKGKDKDGNPVEPYTFDDPDLFPEPSEQATEGVRFVALTPDDTEYTRGWYQKVFKFKVKLYVVGCIDCWWTEKVWKLKLKFKQGTCEMVTPQSGPNAWPECKDFDEDYELDIDCEPNSDNLVQTFGDGTREYLVAEEKIEPEKGQAIRFTSVELLTIDDKG
jgi:hypothetical protein